MTIDIKRNIAQQPVIGDLHAGDVFVYLNDIFMIVCKKDKDNAINLSNGKLVHLDDDTVVEKCRAVLKIEIGPME